MRTAISPGQLQPRKVVSVLLALISMALPSARSRAFIPDGYTKLIKPNKAETAVHGCHYPGDMAVRMRKVLARPRVGVRVCHLLLLLFYKTLPSINNRKNGVLKLKLERQTANVIPRTRSRDFPRFEVCGIARKIRC